MSQMGQEVQAMVLQMYVRNKVLTVHNNDNTK